MVAAACDRTETSDAPVTTTSPAGTSTAPSSAAAKHRDDALVRVVHAVPSGINIRSLRRRPAAVRRPRLQDRDPYRAIDGKRYAFALRPAGMTQAKPLSSNTEDLKDGEFYTAFAMPGDGHGPRLRVVNDHLDSPASGKARLRVVHAGGDAGTVDVHAARARRAVVRRPRLPGRDRLSGCRADRTARSRSSPAIRQRRLRRPPPISKPAAFTRS